MFIPENQEDRTITSHTVPKLNTYCLFNNSWHLSQRLKSKQAKNNKTHNGHQPTQIKCCSLEHRLPHRPPGPGYLLASCAIVSSPSLTLEPRKNAIYPLNVQDRAVLMDAKGVLQYTFRVPFAGLISIGPSQFYSDLCKACHVHEAINPQMIFWIQSVGIESRISSGDL